MARHMGLTVSGVALVLSLGLAHVAAQAQPTLDEIVAKNYASKGGLEKWKSIQTQKMTGVAMAQGMELGMVIYGKRPNMGRQDLTISIPGQNPMTVVNVFDGAKAWMINPAMGSDAPVEMTGPEAETIKDQSDFDGALVDYKQKGHTVELVGSATVGSKKAHHLKITRKGQATQHFYLDVETGVELRVTTEAPGGTVDTELSDYKQVDGVWVPHIIKVSQGGTAMAELRIDKVEFNIPLEDSLFKLK